MTDRTVLETALEATLWTADDDPRHILQGVGIDPDMPFEQFRRALEVGLMVVQTPERVAAMTDADRAALNERVEQYDRWLDIGRRYEESGATGFIRPAPPEDPESYW